MASTSTPTPRAANVITITTYNTIFMTADDVYELVTPFAGPYFYNVFNMGPCTLYIRDDQDPAVQDPNSEMLPSGCADNLILVPQGTAGLRFLAGPGDATNLGAWVTVRLVRG